MPMDLMPFTRTRRERAVRRIPVIQVGSAKEVLRAAAMELA